MTGKIARGENVCKHTPPDNGTRAAFWRGGLAKEQGVFTSERAVAGGLSVRRHAAEIESRG